MFVLLFVINFFQRLAGVMHACMHAPGQLHVYEREVSEVILIRILAQAFYQTKI